MRILYFSSGYLPKKCFPSSRTLERDPCVPTCFINELCAPFLCNCPGGRVSVSPRRSIATVISALHYHPGKSALLKENVRAPPRSEGRDALAVKTNVPARAYLFIRCCVL